jgi:hypothetical protein
MFCMNPINRSGPPSGNTAPPNQGSQGTTAGPPSAALPGLLSASTAGPARNPVAGTTPLLVPSTTSRTGNRLIPQAPTSTHNQLAMQQSSGSSTASASNNTSSPPLRIRPITFGVRNPPLNLVWANATSLTIHFGTHGHEFPGVATEQDFLNCARAFWAITITIGANGALNILEKNGTRRSN